MLLHSLRLLLILLVVLLFHGTTAPSGPGPPLYGSFTIILRHTTLGRTPLDK
jgi:hypothetical protein